MGQRVTGHGSSGSTNLSGSRGSRVKKCDPLSSLDVSTVLLGRLQCGDVQL